jgi:ADP-heptose:LPS heptosyltransferase
MKRLIINFARVGDMVLIIPLLRLLAQDAALELVGRPWSRAVLGHQPFLAAIHTLAQPYRGHGPLDRLLYGAPLTRLADELRAAAFDEIVTFRQESPKVLAWMRGFAGAARIRVLDSGIRAGALSSHPIDMYRACLASAGFAVEAFDPIPRLQVDPAARERARARVRALGERVVSLQAGSSLTHRWWRRRPNLKGLTAAQWAELLARLFADGDCDGVILHGSPLERAEAEAIRAAVEPRWRPLVHDWTGQAPLEDLPGIFSAVRALLSVDTGPAHIAAAVGCPCLVVYGPSDPARWLPRGPGLIVPLVGSAPCQFCVETPQFRRCRRNICLESLSAAAIHAGWLRLRAGLPARAPA